MEAAVYMKPRADRSALKVVKYRPKPRRSQVGRLTQTKANEWKPLSAATLVELTMEGKLSIEQIQRALDTGSVSKSQFRREFYKNIHVGMGFNQDSIKLLQHFSPLL